MGSNKTMSFLDNMQAACCTGLSMDLLNELRKDLNFDVELYEVNDKRWGSWTVSQCKNINLVDAER